MNKLTERLFELSLAFIFLQQCIFPSELTLVSMLFLIASGTLMKLTSKEHFCVRLNPFQYSYALLLVVMFFNSLFGRGTGDHWRGFALCGGGWLTSILMYDCIKHIHPKRFMKIYLGVAVLSLVVILLLLGDRALISRLGHNGSGATVSYYIGNIPIYKSSNGTANVCVIAAAFAFYFASTEGLKRYYAYCLFLLIGLILSGSRKGLLFGVIIAVYLLFFWERRVTRKKMLLALVIPIGVIAIMQIPAVYDLMGKRIISLVLNLLGQQNKLDGNSYLARKDLMTSAIEWIVEKPFLGHGANCYTEYYGVGTESNILQLLTDYGAVGLITYYAFLPSLCYKLYNRKKTKMMSMIGVIIVSFMLQDLFSVRYSWFDCTMWYSIYWYMVNYKDVQNENAFIL